MESNDVIVAEQKSTNQSSWLTPRHGSQLQSHRNISPPRPSDLSTTIQRIEERRALNGSTSQHASSAMSQGTGAHLVRTPQLTAPAASPISPPQGPQSYMSLNSSSNHNASSVTTTEVMLLRLDNEQKRNELEMKRKAIAKLEADYLRCLEEMEAVRQSETQRREQMVRVHKDELTREREMVEALQEQLAAEITKRGIAERSSADASSLIVTLQAAADKASSLERLLGDREQELAEQRELASTLQTKLSERDIEDQANILKGRLSVVEESLTAALQEGDELRSILFQEKNRRVALEGMLSESEDKVDHLSATKSELLTSMQQQEERIEQYRVTEEKLSARIDNLLSELNRVENAQLEVERAHEAEKDALLDEGRKRMQQIFGLEKQVIEAQEERRAAVSKTAHVEELYEAQQKELEHILGRLRSTHSEAEEREAELSKFHVVTVELKGQIQTMKSQVDVLSAELQRATDESRELSNELEDARYDASLKSGFEEQYNVAKRAALQYERELDEERQTATALRERVGALEEQLKAAQSLLASRQGLEGDIALKEEEQARLVSEKHLVELREASLKEDCAHLKQKVSAAEMRLALELERREDVERKLRVLEQASQNSFSVHGKFMALQQYISTATSDSAKALELNCALLEEVREMEAKAIVQEEHIRRLTEEKRSLEVVASELNAVKVDLHRTVIRAREAEAREQELLTQLKSDRNSSRLRDLEGLLLDASRRATAAEAELHELRKRGFGDEESRKASARRNQHETQSIDSFSPISSVAMAQSPSRASPVSQQQLHHPADVSPSSSDEAPVTPRPQTSASPRLQDATEAAAQLEEELRIQQEKFLKQEQRMDVLTEQFGAALAELRRLRQPTSSNSFVKQRTDAPSTEQWSQAEQSSQAATTDEMPPQPPRQTVAASQSPLSLAQRQQRVRLGTQSPPPRVQTLSPGKGSRSSPATSKLAQRAELVSSARDKMAQIFKNAQLIVSSPPAEERRQLKSVLSPPRYEK